MKQEAQEGDPPRNNSLRREILGRERRRGGRSSTKQEAEVGDPMWNKSLRKEKSSAEPEAEDTLWNESPRREILHRTKF